MIVFLEIQDRLKEELWAHLLQNETEQVSIVFSTIETNDDTIIFGAKELFHASPDDFEIHSEFHVELTDEARARIIKRAWDTGTSPVEFHSHPSDSWGANFSMSDMYGFSEYVPHCRWRLRGTPYLAIVVSPTGFDALVWVDSNNKPVGLAAIRTSEERAFIPTNSTIESLNSEVHNHGPRAL